MTEPFGARTEVNRLAAEAVAARALADEQEAVVRRLQSAIAAGEPRARPEQLTAAQAAFTDLKARADQATELWFGARGELADQQEAEPPLFTDDHNFDPVALLPVRVETIWWEPRTLRVRVFPDDILMAHFDPQLTPEEAAVAARYWGAPGPDAWLDVLDRLRPDRAAWAVRASRPGAPPPVVRSVDPAAPKAQFVAMPKRWRFVGLTDGTVVVDKPGRPVPDPLPIGLLREEDSWETDWFAALVAGMAIELNLPFGVDHLDELLVLGVRDEPAAAGAARLRDLLQGHAFAGGLGVLPAGTPTNNTPFVRSGWSSAPTFPPPDATDPADGQRLAAEAVAAAFGLPDAGFLRGCSGAADAEADVVAALSLLTWPTLGKGFAEAAMTHWDLGARTKGSTDSTRQWRVVRDHLAKHVRSRGPVPMLRVGRQPYGVLPVMSLDDLRPVTDVEELLATWLVMLKERWRSVVEAADSTVPRVRPDVPVDQVAVDALTRQPVACSLEMRRMDGPAFTLRKTGVDEQPTVFGVPGLPPDGELRWTFQSDGYTDLGLGLDEQTGRPNYIPRITPDAEAFPARATATADYFATVRRFLSGELSAADFHRDWPVLLSSTSEQAPRRSTFFHLDVAETTDAPAEDDGAKDATGLLDALLLLPNWWLQDGDDGEDDPLRRALAMTGDVEQLVADVVEGLVSDRERAERTAAAAADVEGLVQLERAARALTTVPVTRLPELLLEVMDVYAVRLDAWVTSLATARLAVLREGGVDGVRFGAYGWVRDLPKPAEREERTLPDGDTAIVATTDGYVHAPSLHHAATAAVLRSGFQGHPGDQAFAVDLTSRRARVARWLLGGVRNGQNLGALLGYRFERALHDAELDGEVERFRDQFGTPTAEAPTPPEGGAEDLWANSTEAIAARNVVDGMRVARDPATAKNVARDARVDPIVDDLVDALDAVGDLILAESVHQLLGGSPLRAGMTADTLGRGGDVPDVWHCLSTPHRARAVTNRVAVLLPAPSGDRATGWPADPLAAVVPAVESWAAQVVGPAAGVVVAGSLGDPGTPFEVGLDRLGLGALSAVLDAAGGAARLGAAVRTALQAAPDTPVAFSGPAWRRVHGLAVRLRALLVAAQPLLPRHLPGEPADVPLDLTDTRTRLAAFAQAVPADTPGAAALLKAAAAAPDAPEVGGPEGWLSTARVALAEVLGVDVPLLPALVGAAVNGRGDVPGADVSDWLRRQGDVRPAARALDEALLLTTLGTGARAPLRVAQHPVGAPADDRWIGGTFPVDRRPPATTHLVWHAPTEPGARVTGLLLDEWVELLPGSDHLPEAAAGTSTETELTGVAFHYDRPDAKPPHAVLIAVPAEGERGWTANGLLQVLRETMQLATLRAVDDEDMPRTRSLLPAIRITPVGETAKALQRFETFRPGLDPDGAYRLQPRYRTQDRVEGGLAARVHDPLWLLTRQWQFGEFAAQDAGSPAVVHMAGGSAPIDAWRPVGATAWTPWNPSRGPLDTQIEDEPVRVDERLRAHGGAQLLRMLADAGVPVPPAPPALAPGDPDGSIVDLAGGRVPDAAAVAAALDAGTFDPARDPALAAVTGRWRAWWTAQLAERGPDCFDPHRFEHAAELSVGGAVLRAGEYLGDGLEWYGFDVQADPEPGPAPAGHRIPFAVEGLPSTVTYGGLPADRFWEMEDARIDLGAMQTSTLDTGRLLLISFATVFSNDWFLVPLEVPVGSLSAVDELMVRDVFGRNHLLERAGRDDPSWSMFTLSSPDPDLPAASGLLVLPAEGGQVGAPLERVGLTRDELANLAWAVQHRYTDGRGEVVERRDAWLKIAPEPTPPGDLPRYRVQTDVPNYWFPLVPEPLRPDAIRFRLVAPAGNGPAAEPAGRLIEPGLWVHEEEVPRDGAWVQRRPVLARWFDGSWHAWVRREKNPGAGESSSGLAFDTVRPTEPWPS